tara:strand:- start:105 stop:512 length:408 start_codon:yes stop_codon:yes gene_type:complete
VQFIKYCFAVSSFDQASKVILECNKRKISPVIYIKHYMIKGLGIYWLKEFNHLLKKKFSKRNFNLFVDCKKDYGLFIALVELKIRFIKVNIEKKTIKRLAQIAEKNKVLLNPKISIVDLSKIKNIDSKIEKYIFN